MRYLALLTLLACANKAPPTPPASPTPPPPPDPQTDSRTVPLTETPAPSDVKAPGNLPVLTAEEQAARDAARGKCIEDCVKSRQMQAISADAIAQQCQNECLIQHPIEQAEILPEEIPMFETP